MTFKTQGKAGNKMLRNTLAADWRRWKSEVEVIYALSASSKSNQKPFWYQNDIYMVLDIF